MSCGSSRDAVNSKKQGGGGLGHKLKLFPVKSVWAKVHEAKDSLMQVELC